MSVGAVLDETWTLFTKFFMRFFTIAFAVLLVVNLVNAVLAEVVERERLGAVLLSLVFSAVSVVGTIWLQGAFVNAVRDARDGSFDAGIGDVFRSVVPRLGTLVIVGLLAGIAIGVGFFLLIVPGLILLTIWAVVAPVVMVENSGVGEAFGRSRALVRGYGLQVFAIILITSLLTLVFGGLLTAVFAFLPAFLQNWLGASIAGAIVAPFSAIALTITYFKLREAHGEDEPVPPAPA
jgi:hypothetical protein